MNNYEFEQFVMDNGKDILRFCKMAAGNEENGGELYQDTMLKLMERLTKINSMQNVKSYALSISILLWKNKKKKYSVRNRIAPISSFEECVENGEQFVTEADNSSPEQEVLNKMEQEEVRSLVAQLPDKYKMPIYLYYSAEMKIEEIAVSLHIPAGTVKTRIRKAKQLLKKRLEAIGYDR